MSLSAAKLRSGCPLLLAVSAAAGFLMGIVLLLMAWKGLPAGSFTRDPNTVLDGHLYIGFLSQVGIFLWSAAASACLFAYLLLARAKPNKHAKSFFLSCGLLSLLLGLDDAFLLHEHFFPYLGIPEKAVYGAYAACILLVLFRFRVLILESEFLLLASALCCFAFSVAVDWAQPDSMHIFLYEDGAKLFGILSWMSYFFHTAYRQLGERLRPISPESGEFLVACASRDFISAPQESETAA